MNADQAPMTVNAEAGKATNLDADKLDGQDASSFAPKAVEPWHEINTPGEPEFQNGWGNAYAHLSLLSTAAFYKYPYGVVRLKGVVSGGNKRTVIFSLPCGYGPAQQEWHVTYLRAAHDNQYYPGRSEIVTMARTGQLWLRTQTLTLLLQCLRSTA